ncbi:hypothetical protein AKJ57_04140 [candidate division MSBL1 archaeon SCGC-AAA259A05]|uniref:Uncharacterized protein n=1 Tax=candidate division MSBL1 archaeon SCGC-AAA259A05 TaxID=1698259 RepID=A0A133U8C8_9EURY|nr:hypothetical protein AKJ57_04140 [candidate division MSBL1 archaeon SCGC-AAA259A05]
MPGENVTEDFSSMSKDEKKGYLKALGVDPEKLGEDPQRKRRKIEPWKRKQYWLKGKNSRGKKKYFSGKDQQKFGGLSVWHFTRY